MLQHTMITFVAGSWYTYLTPNSFYVPLPFLVNLKITTFESRQPGRA